VLSLSPALGSFPSRLGALVRSQGDESGRATRRARLSAIRSARLKVAQLDSDYSWRWTLSLSRDALGMTMPLVAPVGTSRSLLSRDGRRPPRANEGGDFAASPFGGSPRFLTRRRPLSLFRTVLCNISYCLVDLCLRERAVESLHSAFSSSPTSSSPQEARACHSFARASLLRRRAVRHGVLIDCSKLAS